MKIELKEYVSSSGEKILFNGNPDFELLDKLSFGPGDIWHSSFEQGYKNAFLDIKYQTATFFWYVFDFENLDVCVSWRINPNSFAIRESVWKTIGGFDTDYINYHMQALDFGFNALRFSGAVPLYVKGLYKEVNHESVKISAKDRYSFYIKNFKFDHSLMMLYRKGLWNFKEWNALFFAKKNFKFNAEKSLVKPRDLKSIHNSPRVSYIIPTMMRQNFTLTLLDDLKNQTFKPSQVVIVDATPINERDEQLYNPSDYPFELIVKWQTTKGSCRARNEAIDLCTGDYIIFGDDDIRLDYNFVENHIKFLQTYNADACNGLDIRADNENQNLDDLKQKLDNFGNKRYLTGVSQVYNNANNCVSRKYVDKLVGNDINYDGGYGEDIDFGFDLVKAGAIVLHNPFSTNLHLKPPMGGYRFWGNQAKILGKKRKKQPWELDNPVKWIRPVPSPTIMYYNYKHFGPNLVNEYRHRYFFLYLFKNSIWSLPIRILKLPFRQLQFNKSIFYAKKLMELGKRTK